MKYAFVRAHYPEFGVSRMCQVLKISRSGYYDWQGRGESRRSQRDQVLLKDIRRIHQDSKEAYGAMKTWQALRQAGVDCGKNRAARLRKLAAIEARRKRKFRLAYRSRQSAAPAPNLLKWPFKAAHPDQIWVTDVTFIPTRSGWLYLAVMIDLHTRFSGGLVDEGPAQPGTSQ